MRRIVLGTAGHIDHGKTSLVRALTGVDTDRLKEERERGITIELGFTHLTLPDGTEVGFVDVPGHERFVRTMIAGASGIDLVLLVLAADEGVMPQTREHLDICSLLGVRDGLVVLNKIDAVDPEMAALAAEEAAQTVAGTFLAGRPIIPFSAKTGEGKDRLLAAISDAAERIGERSARGPFRMSVDRVFTMKGFGTVVTGTSTGGRVKVGDTLQVHPSPSGAGAEPRPARSALTGAVGRVRGLQVHGKEETEALAGSRTAINLQGLDRDQVPRGSVLAAPGALVPSQILDVEYRHLPTAPESFKPKRVRFLVGTQEVVGNLKILDAPSPKPGATHVAQVRLESPIAARAGDRFVLRTYSPMVTVGGGRILDSHARKRRPTDVGAAAHLASLAGEDPSSRIETLVRDAGGLGVPMSELALHLPPSESEDAASVTRALAKAGKLEVLDGAVPRAIARETFDRIAGALAEAVVAFHRAEPSKPGMPRGVALGEALRSAKVGGPDATAIGEAVLRKMEAAKRLLTVAGDVKIPTHVPKLDAATSDLRPVVETTYRDGGLMPPTIKEIGEKHGTRAREVQSVIALLHREGVLVKVSQDLYFHRDAIGSIQQKLVDYLRERSKITTLEFKDLAGNLTRKFMIPLLEHFDAVRLTMRVGEERVLRKKEG